METKEDQSYGVIPLYKNGDSWEVFLINQYGSAGDVYWTFPKGHPEGDETESESALRELKEETQIVVKVLHDKKRYMQEYSFKYKDTLIHKQVIYYIGEVESKDFSIQEEEVKEALWLSCKQAYEKLTYEHAKTMFKQVLDDLNCPMQ